MLRIIFVIGFLVIRIHAFNEYIHYPEVQQSYNFHRTPKQWFDALKTCFEEDAILALPKNTMEANVLKNIFTGYPVSSLPKLKNKDLMWIGFHDMFNEGEFVTHNGIPIQYFYHDWITGEPNNDGNEDCVGLRRSGLLNDSECDTSTVFICQKNKIEVPFNNSLCFTHDPAYEYSRVTKKCYKFHLYARKWPMANDICMAEGGHLAIINSEAEKDFIVTMINKPGLGLANDKVRKSVLVGFHDIFEEGYYITLKGEELQRSGYARWADGEPNNKGKNEDCGALYYSGGLNDCPCDQPYFFVCEIDPRI